VVTDISLLREMPQIRRAREYHLYDTAGRRYLDLYQNNGRAVLGHRPSGMSVRLKNTLSRGVFAEYPSSEEGKLLKAAAALIGEAFPVIRYYRTMERALTAAGFPGRNPADPARGETGELSLWRPFLPLSGEVRFALPVLPLPGMECGVILCAAAGDLPDGDIPSPVTAAALTRCLWGLKALTDREPAEEPAGLPAFSGWERRGPYLVWTGPAEEYPAFFRAGLTAGVLIPPSPEMPAVLPPELTSGDLKCLQSAFTRGE